MGLIVDTSVFVSGERGRLDLPAFRRAWSADGPSMASITLSELLVGIHRCDSDARRQRRDSFLEAQTKIYPVIAFGTSEALVHARINATLQGLGLAIGAYDSIIAATALAHDWSVVTLNLSEFQRVPGLKVVDASPWLVN
jgi:predicted nucleic acid-binding protein